MTMFRVLNNNNTTSLMRQRSHDLISRANRSLYRRESNSFQRWLSSSSPTTTKEIPKKSTRIIPIPNYWKNEIFNNNSPFMNTKRAAALWMSFSELAGNLSFVCVSLAYIHTDIFWLRGLAMGSISLSIIFQYYRPQPLWIPIRWNILLLAINTAMISILFFEQHQANSMPPDLETMFQDGDFERRGFSRMEFNQLFRLGKEVHFENGEYLTMDGEKNKRLYFVKKGQVEILKNGIRLAVITPHHFVGELAFLDYMLQVDDTLPSASADAMVVDGDTNNNNNDNGGHVSVWVWDYDELKQFLKSERTISNALSAYMNHDVRKKLILTGVAMADLDNTSCGNGGVGRGGGGSNN